MSKKIVFMGKSIYQNGYEISAVYTQPPQRSNRGQKVNKSPIQNMAETLNLDVRIPNSIRNNKEEYDYIKKLDSDICIVVAYGQILPKEILNLTKKGFINIHASLLPLWRGSAPIQRSLMNLDLETGITIMQIIEKLDSGPICNSYPLKILENENAENLSSRLSLLASEKITDNIESIFDNKAVFVNQDESKATYADKILKSEGKINWKNSANKVLGQINGLYPSPGAWFIFNGERYKILEANISDKMGDSGFILSDKLEIGCNDKSVKVNTIQREGKRPQKTNEFMLGSKLKKGSNLNNV